MLQLYYLRHGQSRDNADYIWSSLITPLTDKGYEQARQAGRQAKKAGQYFDLIISSPLLRTRSTAVATAAELAYKLDAIEYHDLLVERDFGVLVGTPGSELLGKQSWDYREVDDIADVETMEDLQQRAEQALTYIRSRPEKRILIVGHGTFGRALRRAIAGERYELEYLASRPTNRLANGEITRLI